MEIEQNVYFDKKVKRFVQIRGTKEKGVLIGGYCTYYNDSITNISPLTELSNQYVNKNLVKVDFVDKFAIYDGVGWRVK